MDVKTYIREQLKAGKINEAMSVCQQYIENYQTDEEYVTFFILFKIYQAELQGEETTVFSYTTEPDNLIEHYHKLKFYLRRLEFDAEEETGTEEIMDYFIRTGASANALWQIAQFSLADCQKVLRKLTKLFKDAGKCEQAEAFKSLLSM